MTPERFAEIKDAHALLADHTNAHYHRGELIEYVQRLEARIGELLAANGHEVERRRAAEQLPARIFATLDALRISGESEAETETPCELGALIFDPRQNGAH
jgi:hypothetical protein